MFKKGFTLQEALITLAIIGVVAAITVPRLAKITPDQNQTRYLKAYATLTDLTNRIIIDPALYFGNIGECEGLDCTNIPQEDSISDRLWQDINNARNADGTIDALPKYVYILANNMHLATNVETTPINNGQQNALIFRTKDGILWAFANNDNNQNVPAFQVDIDINGFDAPNFNFEDANRSPNEMPDRFTFTVAMDGSIDAADRLGQTYLQNADTNLYQKSNDALNNVMQSIQQDEQRHRTSLDISACRQTGGRVMCPRRD